MSLDNAAAARAALPLQFLTIELMPIAGGKLSVAMQATLLDEDALELVGQDLGHECIDTIDEALAIIRQNIASVVPVVVA